MALNYAEEKFYQAVRSLASEGTLKFRLACAAEYLIRLKAEDFPDDELRSRFSEIVQKLTAQEPQRDEGSLQASVAAMNDQEVSHIAEEIVSIYADIAGRDPRNLYHPAPTKKLGQ